MSGRAAAALALLAGLAVPVAAAAPPAGGGPIDTGAEHKREGGSVAQPPLVITMPDTQPALPSGRIEMDPSSQGPSTGDPDKLEPNIDGPVERVR